MKYLLDTCVISEFTKPQPHSSVIQWLQATPIQFLYLSSLTIGEIQKGISQLDVSIRQQRLQSWLDEDIPLQFKQRILDVDEQTCRLWGQLCGQYGKQGRNLPVIDSLLAATAISRQMVLVTRNEKDFSIIAGLQLLNPWLSISN
ncbi:type II toxin-antitoxin system VapC family toxin [Acinetobacter puyangensis]|uniref:PIN domain-containing protein n=1 Tax=Acinetobacter puyangensis TaxID=1096779 RepID=A0A240E8M0_9GAMM|nr:type II toxin-antitoxin system VapC family toxin [Acinetobacter puyangensis]SNX44972.1 hypothetical protein SAMN05421731_104339 [Acinetobacter puyangensis]